MVFIYFGLVFLNLLHSTYNECSSLCLNNFMILYYTFLFHLSEYVCSFLLKLQKYFFFKTFIIDNVCVETILIFMG